MRAENQLRSSDFGGSLEKYGCTRSQASSVSSGLPGRGGGAVLVEALTGALAHPVVEEGIAGSGIEGEEPVAGIDESHVRDAADVEDRQRRLQARGVGEGAMEHRHERRPLPALGDVGGAEIVDDRGCADGAPAPRRRRAAP